MSLKKGMARATICCGREEFRKNRKEEKRRMGIRWNNGKEASKQKRISYQTSSEAQNSEDTSHNFSSSSPKTSLRKERKVYEKKRTSAFSFALHSCSNILQVTKILTSNSKTSSQVVKTGFITILAAERR